MRKGAVAAIAALGLSFTVVGGAEAACSRASVTGAGPGKHAATEAAKESLRVSLAATGYKGVGRITTKCEEAFPLTMCKATQRACK